MSIYNLDHPKPQLAWTETTRSGLNVDDGNLSVRHSIAASTDSTINCLLELCIQEDSDIQKADIPQKQKEVFAIPLMQNISIDQGQIETASIATDSWRPTIKTEDNPSKDANQKVRRNICRKIFDALIKKHNMPKLQAQELAVELEQKVNNLSPFGAEKSVYATNIRELLIKLKVNSTLSSVERILTEISGGAQHTSIIQQN
jgi:hypothetical protein